VNQLYAEILQVKKLLSSNGFAEPIEEAHPLLSYDPEPRGGNTPYYIDGDDSDDSDDDDSDDSDDSDDEHTLSEEDVNGGAA